MQILKWEKVGKCYFALLGGGHSSRSSGGRSGEKVGNFDLLTHNADSRNGFIEYYVIMMKCGKNKQISTTYRHNFAYF